MTTDNIQWTGDHDDFTARLAGTPLHAHAPHNRTNHGRHCPNHSDKREMKDNFSERPRFGLNSGVSARPQHEWLDMRMKERELLSLDNEYVIQAMRTMKDMAFADFLPPTPKWARGKTAIPVRNSKTDPKIQRNDQCPCSSGKKYKRCCIIIQP
jgi:hypothetical protein